MAEVLTVPADMKIQDFSLYYDNINKEIYLAGGVSWDNVEISKKVSKYNIRTKLWSAMPDMLEAR